MGVNQSESPQGFPAKGVIVERWYKYPFCVTDNNIGDVS
jgi:hypothetical protein